MGKLPSSNQSQGSQESLLNNAWMKYYGAIEEARAMLEATPRFKEHPEYRPRAYSSLIEAQAMAYNYAIAPRLNRPFIYSQSIFHSNVFALGQNAPDFKYGGLFLDGKETYRLSGKLCDLKACLMQVYSHLLGHQDCKDLGNYDFHEFVHGSDGAFEFIVSGTPHEGNWIRLDPDSRYNFLLLRRIFGDYFDNTGEMRIEMLGDHRGHDLPDHDIMAERISQTADFLKWLVKVFAIDVYEMFLKGAGAKNKFHFITGQDMSEDYAGSPSTIYGTMVYSLGDDEALIIEYEPPVSAYWSLQLGDVWCNARDFFFNQTDVNMMHAVLDDDGKCRFVVSMFDPGVPNWLDTTGNHEGLATLRNYRATSKFTAPLVKKVQLSALRHNLPGTTPQLTFERRQEALDYRHRGFRHLYGD
jgi:Protein of unknown function (DUF1214)